MPIPICAPDVAGSAIITIANNIEHSTTEALHRIRFIVPLAC
jgi:hypothetical protein